MSEVLSVKPHRCTGLEWAVVIAGLLILYVPTFYDFFRIVFSQAEHSHAPIILAISYFLIWNKRRHILRAPARPSPWAGGGMLIFGLLLYIIGRSQDILLLEVGSQIPVIAGSLAVMHGMSAVRVAWFPLCFLVFMLPVPSFVIDALTGPLKQSASTVAEIILYGAGYPIARDGAAIRIGQYQLLVTEACSGLNTMFSLGAVGLLYVYLVRPAKWWRSAILLTSIMPIAFMANVMRVMVLSAVTYHFGEAAGQGFLHNFSGVMLFTIALLLVFLLDRLLRVVGTSTLKLGAS